MMKIERCFSMTIESSIFRRRDLILVGVSTPNFALQVFDLHHDGFEGLLGMNFVRHFNFEVRPAEGRILADLIRPSSA